MKNSANKLQLSFPKTGGWGGRRRGAGRKNLSGKVNHMSRPSISAKVPGHVTLRLSNDVLSLRRKPLLREFAISVREARRFGLKVIQFGVLGNHIHLVVEAKNNEALSRGMQSLTIRLAKRIKSFAEQLGRPIKGAVFSGRYHLNLLSTPSQVRNALIYVLFNEDKHSNRRSSYTFSVYSSAFRFKDLKKLKVSVAQPKLLTFERFWAKIAPIDEVLSAPESWLGQKGWQLAKPA